MRPVWKGAVTFGLVSIPVRLYAATETHDVSFRQVHAADGGRIRYRRVCEIDGEEVPYGDIAHGYELPDGDLVVLTDADLEQLPLSSSKSIDVVEFVPAEQINPLLFNRAYYAEAEKIGQKPYVLMRDTLAKSDRVAVVKVTLRKREALAVLRPQGDVLIVQTLLWPEEVRDPASLAPHESVTVADQEVAMATTYIDTLAADFDPEEFTDGYRTALTELIATKAEGRDIGTKRPADEGGGKVVDLMDALQASVRAAQEQRRKRRPTARPKDADSAPAPSTPTKKPASRAKKPPRRSA